MFLIFAMLVLFYALPSRANDDTEDTRPLPAKVNKVPIPAALVPLPSDATGVYYMVTLTNAGHYEFRVNKHEAYQVVIEFPFGYTMQLSEGDRWHFTVPRNYQPCNVYFIRAPQLLRNK